MEDGKRKAYGAGLLSSIGELEYSCREYAQNKVSQRQTVSHNTAMNDHLQGRKDAFDVLNNECSTTESGHNHHTNAEEDVGHVSTPEFRKWEPFQASVQAYPITTYQPIYYVAESLQDAKAKINAFGDYISRARQFTVEYDEAQGVITTDIEIVRLRKNNAPLAPNLSSAWPLVSAVACASAFAWATATTLTSFLALTTALFSAKIGVKRHV
jgi:hypothetical protein